MSSPAQRINTLIKSLNLNINSFSKECGYPSSATIWRLINEGAKPSTPTLNKICNRFPQVNREWLMTGYGSMYLDSKNLEDDLTVTAKQVLEVLEPKIELIIKEIEVLKTRVLGLEIHGAHKTINKKKTNGV
tara:strand:- start:161 stop:556 length:396 start_codon:yes stop_codon:yes gene_type:complete